MSPLAHRVARTFVASAGGACLGLFVGLVAIAVAPDDGFGDLAAAAVTTVFLVPLGLIIGGVIGWWTGRHGTPEPVAVHDTEVREETT